MRRPTWTWPLILCLLSAGVAGGPARAAGLPAQAAPCAQPPTSSFAVDVRDRGAVGDGHADDTAAIQSAVNEVAGTGGTVLVPDGIYLIDASRSVRLGSRMTFQMSPGAILRAVPNDLDSYVILRVQSANDVTVVGGTLEGERSRHRGSGREWGMGLSILGSSRVTVDGVTARECWGDGFYIGDAGTHDVTVCRVVADHNRRQGMSITQGRHLVVRDSLFQRTRGTEPEAGLDIEPNQGDTVDDVLLTRNVFRNNAGGGLQIGPAVVDRRTTFVTRLLVEDNDVVGNGVGAISPPNYGIQLSASTGNTLRNNRVKDNAGIGIGVLYTTDATVRGNIVTGTLVSGPGEESGAGIIFEKDQGSLGVGNTVTGNAGHGIFTWRSDATLKRNTVRSNGLDP